MACSRASRGATPWLSCLRPFRPLLQWTAPTQVALILTRVPFRNARATAEGGCPIVFNVYERLKQELDWRTRQTKR